MPEGSIRLTRRRLLGSIATVGGASAATGAGTMAYFSDTESSTGNTIQAGTIELVLGGGQTTTFLDQTDVMPGQDGTGSIQLENVGSIAAKPEIEVADVRSYENTEVGNEGSKDTTAGGELEDYLDVEASVDGMNAWSRTKIKDLPTGPHRVDTTISPSGGTRTFTLDWWFVDPGDNTVREAQSDSIELDLTFRLVQEGSP